MKYAIATQIHLTEAEHNKVNAEGLNSESKHLAHIDMQVGMGKDISNGTRCPGKRICPLSNIASTQH